MADQPDDHAGVGDHGHDPGEHVGVERNVVDGNDALIAALLARRAASVEQEARLLVALRNASALLATHSRATGDDPRG